MNRTLAAVCLIFVLGSLGHARSPEGLAYESAPTRGALVAVGGGGTTASALMKAPH